MSSSSSTSDGLDSDSSDDFTRNCKPLRKAKATADDGATDKTPKEFECNGCGKSFYRRSSLYVHISKCQAYQKRKNELSCKWCHGQFPNHTKLVNHAVNVHGDSSYKEINVAPKTNVIPKTFTCHICNTTFRTKVSLRYHIRAIHFNLIGKAPYAAEKKVNQVWFEKVMNSNNIIEIKKVRRNTLVMKKINENTAIKLNSDNERIIDVSHMYPTSRFCTSIRCQYCKRYVQRSRYKNHFNEVHLNIRKFHCDNCNKSFKRLNILNNHKKICYSRLVQKLKNKDESSIETPS